MRFFKMPLIHGNFSYASSVALQFWNVSGAFEFIYDVWRSKSFISDKDIMRFQSLAEMRRWSHRFSKMH